MEKKKFPVLVKIRNVGGNMTVSIPIDEFRKSNWNPAAMRVNVYYDEKADAFVILPFHLDSAKNVPLDTENPV